MDKTLRTSAEYGGSTDTGWLKIWALVFMTIDHLGVIIFPGVTELRVLGRIALPLYVWCLVIGCDRTHDIFRYAFRLLLLALISQPINMMALGNSWQKLNILFLLCLGVLAIAGIQKKFYFSQFWAPLLCYVLLGFVSIDYGWRGLTFILLLYMARHTRGGLAATYLAFALFWGASSSQISSFAGVEFTFLQWSGVGTVLQSFFRMQGMIWLALPLILIPTQTRCRLPKWLGYGFYPLHLLVIALIRLLMGTPLKTLLSTL